MTEEEFQKHISALATKRLEKPKKMSTQFGQFWGEIVAQQYNFDRGKWCQNTTLASTCTVNGECRLLVLIDKISKVSV